MTARKISVAIADDHPLIRAGLAAVIQLEPRFQLVGEAADGNETVEAYRRLRPDVMLVDLRMPGCTGVEAIKRIRDLDPRAHIVILSSFDGEEDIYRALRAGARSYILKDACRADLIDCIALAAQGRRWLSASVSSKLADRMARDGLTSREVGILRLIAAGKSNKLVGVAVGISETTVKFHVGNILAKLQASSRIEAVYTATRRGILSHDD
jgi:DNA-binding NarL/FixJ family response regulator